MLYKLYQKQKKNYFGVCYTLFFLTVFFAASVQAQVTIGSDTRPKIGALLDLNQNYSSQSNTQVNSQKGLGLPRVELTSSTSLTPAVASPTTGDNTAHIGLTVYNVGTGLAQGIYTWNGTQWIKILSSGDAANNAWLLTGNTGTNPTTNYVGTFDAVDLSVRTTALERMRITAAGNVGIRTSSPAKPLHVNSTVSGAKNPIRLEGLPQPPDASTSTALNSLVIDNSGDVYISQASSAGQIIRIELEETTGVNTGTNPDYGGTNSNGNERPVRIFNVDSQTPSRAPNNSSNYINTIRGARFRWNYPAGTGNGAPSRTTDQVILPIGVYKVTLRIVGMFSSSAQDNTLFIKAIVDGNEYSLSNNAMNSRETATFLYEDFINITDREQSLDFTVDTKDGTQNTFQIVPGATPGNSSGVSIRSLLLIERLR